MKKFFDSKLNRVVHEIIAGELITTKDVNSVLVTLLGSCVAVCLADRINGVFGMNHFMLPGETKEIKLADPRYGTFATDSLIGAMLRRGADRKFLEAKVFGAGKVLDSKTFNISLNNAEFIQRYLNALRIPVKASDLGKDYGRKIIYYCKTGEVYVKKITEFSASPEALERERQFFKKLRLESGGL